MQTIDFRRQLDIFVPSAETKIVVIGAGGIGSWVVLGLSKTGFQQIKVWDGDDIESHNLPNQFFSEVNGNKAVALSKSINNVTAVPEFWTGQTLSADVIVIAVDKMSVRKQIVETQRAPLIIDARIGGELIRIVSISPIDYGSKKHYLNSWYSDDEAVELPCTARTIADTGFFVGGIVCNLIRKFLKESVIIREIVFNSNLLEFIKIERR